MATRPRSVHTNRQRREREGRRLLRRRRRDERPVHRDLKVIIIGVKHRRLLQKLSVLAVWIPPNYIPHTWSKTRHSVETGYRNSRWSGIESRHSFKAESSSATIFPPSPPANAVENLCFLIEYCARYVMRNTLIVRGGAHYRSERRREDVIEFQVRNKEGHLRRLPRRLRECRAGFRRGPVLVIALHREFKVEANTQIVTNTPTQVSPGQLTLRPVTHMGVQGHNYKTDRVPRAPCGTGQSPHSSIAQDLVSPKSSFPEFIHCRQRLSVYPLPVNANRLRMSDTDSKDDPTRLRPHRTLQEHRGQLSTDR